MMPQIQNGELLNVLGRAAEHQGIQFVPGVVELEKGTGSTDCYFRDHPEFKAANTISCYDVAFVRARIPCIFGYTPDPAEIEKTFLYEGFVCVLGETDCIPYICTDYYGCTGLEFSSLVPSEQKEKIALAFWSLFLADWNDVADFENSVEQYGFTPRVTLGCRAGEVYAEEE